jgi:antitoxin VapB
MSLTIENPEAGKLARELAELEGVTPAEAVIHALRDRLDQKTSKKQKDKEALLKELKEIRQRCAARPVLDSRSPEEILYNEEGLPE